MHTANALRRLVLLAILAGTLGGVVLLTNGAPSLLLAAESPLAQPWPTLVVVYPRQLPAVAADPVVQSQAVGVSFLFHSPLPLPTPLPDALPPSTILSVTGELGHEGWLRSPATLTFAITDNVGAGVSEVRLAGVAEWTEREYYYPPLVVTDEGIHTLEYRSLDMAHNAETVQRRQLRIDRTPPLLAVPVLAGNQLVNGWYNTPVTLRLQAEDNLSGLAALERLDETAGWQATDAITRLSQTGPQQITWRAVDRAGNASAAQQVSLLIDLTPPTTTHTFDPPPAGAWFSQPVSVTLAAVDQGAGLFATHLRLNNESSWRSYAAPISLSEDGRYTLAYYSSDRALNLETPHTVQLALDRTAPQLEYTVNGLFPPPVWVRSSATLVVTATDALAGVSLVEWTLDGADWQMAAAPLLINRGGEHAIQLRALDRAGNVGHLTATVGVDATPPQSDLALSGGRGPNGWFVTPVTLTLTAVDGQSGVAELQYRLNGGPWQPYTQPILLSDESVQQVAYRALDQVGNEEAANLARFNLDLSDPSAQALVRYGDLTPTGWYISPVTLALTGDDDASGLAGLDYQIDGGGWQRYTGEFTLARTGEHRIDYRAVDSSGRLGVRQTLTVALDLTAPLIQLALPTALLHGVADLREYITVEDAESGVTATTVLLDGASYQPGQVLRPGTHKVQIVATNGADLHAEQTHSFVVGAVTFLPLVVQTK